MPRKLTVVPELCSGCRTCELVCAAEHFGVNNPKKSAIRVISLYPHPVIRMPIVCSQCREPKCADNCPTGAIVRKNGVVQIVEEDCVSCLTCVESCPFGAMFVHEDLPIPFKCDLCGGQPVCPEECPKGAIRFIPTHLLGQAHRLNNVLSYTHMKEIEFIEKGEKKHLRYAEIEGNQNDY